MHVQKPAAVEQLRPDLVALSNMAIAFLPATFRLHNVSEATREVVNGVRYALLANAIDAAGAECVCELIVLERPWILVGEFDKQRELLHSNCTTEDEDATGADATIGDSNRIANDANNFNFNPVFVNQGQMDPEFLRNLEAQVVPPSKPRATKKPTAFATKPPHSFDTTALDEALRLIEADILPFERQPHLDTEHQQQPIGVDVVDCPHAMNRVEQAHQTLRTDGLQQHIDDMLKAIRLTETATDVPNVQPDVITEQLSDTQKSFLDAFFGVDTVDTQSETTSTASITTTIGTETTTPDNSTPSLDSSDALSPLADVATPTGATASTEDATPPTATTAVTNSADSHTATALVVDASSEATSMAADALAIASDAVADHSEVLLLGFKLVVERLLLTWRTHIGALGGMFFTTHKLYGTTNCGTRLAEYVD